MTLFAYKIFFGLLAGVLVDTSWENVKNRVREHYKDDERYLEYLKRHKELLGSDAEPFIEVYPLSELFEDNIDFIFDCTV